MMPGPRAYADWLHRTMIPKWRAQHDAGMERSTETQMSQYEAAWAEVTSLAWEADEALRKLAAALDRAPTRRLSSVPSPGDARKETDRGE